MGLLDRLEKSNKQLLNKSKQKPRKMNDIFRTMLNACMSIEWPEKVGRLFIYYNFKSIS